MIFIYIITRIQKKDMIGITDDHEFKTKQGWKLFSEIDINIDELYCWDFSLPEYDGDPMELNYRYTHRKLIGNNWEKYPDQKYIKPLKKHFQLVNNCELFEIKNDYMDLTSTKNYIIPTVFIDECDRYGNISDIHNLEELYKSIKYWDSNDDIDKSAFGFSEKLIEKEEYNDYNIRELTFKICQNDFRRIFVENKIIISFTMPDLENKDHYTHIYVRRNGKEFWV